MIKFLEDRQLLSGGIVEAGEKRSFSPEDEAAFVAQGVAELVEPAKKIKEEVTGNG